jgi:hypothetical protein
MAQSKWRNMGATVAGLAPLFRSARRVECDGFPLASSAVQAGAEVITLARRELLPSKAPGGKMPSSTLVSPSSSRPMPAGPLELPAPSVPHATARSPCPVAGDPKVIRGRAKRGDFQPARAPGPVSARGYSTSASVDEKPRKRARKHIAS